jgi:hypothetical protein
MCPGLFKNTVQESVLGSAQHSLFMVNTTEAQIQIEELPSVMMRGDIHPTVSGNE